jgi:predicted ABC-type ATPase
MGGHNVPPEVVRRRFGKGLRNLFHTYMGLVDYCAIFDNSTVEPRLVFERSDGSDTEFKPLIYAKILKMLRGKK